MRAIPVCRGDGQALQDAAYAPACPAAPCSASGRQACSAASAGPAACQLCIRAGKSWPATPACRTLCGCSQARDRPGNTDRSVPKQPVRLACSLPLLAPQQRCCVIQSDACRSCTSVSQSDTRAGAGLGGQAAAGAAGGARQAPGGAPDGPSRPSRLSRLSARTWRRAAHRGRTRGLSPACHKARGLPVGCSRGPCRAGAYLPDQKLSNSGLSS